MADKAINELVAAERITPLDMFVLEQEGSAKKLTGQVLLNWLVSAADGHGGIQSYEKVSTSLLEDTYRFILADTSTVDIVITNGRGITGVNKTSSNGLVDTYTLQFNDNTTSAFTVTNGQKGDKGDNVYLWIKYASQEPTETSNSFGDVPDDWIGIYSGSLSTAPMDWRQYKWFEIKGVQGETGNPATVLSNLVEYLSSDSGNIVPSGSWSISVPAVPQGMYLWTRVTTTFNTGQPVVHYSVSRMGLDGLGSVQSVAGQAPGPDGNVDLRPNHLGALSTDGSSTMSNALNMGRNRVINLAAPSASTDAVTKQYADSKLSLTGGSMQGSLDMATHNITNLPAPVEDSEPTTKKYVDDLLQTFEGSVACDLVWSNSDPSQAFASQSVAVDLSNYFMFIAVAAYSQGYGNSVTAVVPKGRGTFISANISHNMYRTITASDNGLSFGDGYFANTYGTAAVDNKRIIPLEVYGLRRLALSE